MIVDVRPGFFTRFLSTLIDPNIVGLLFLAGSPGSGSSSSIPGVVIPGAFGAICMVMRALRLLGAAALVGRPDPRAARCRAARVDAHVTTTVR